MWCEIATLYKLYWPTCKNMTNNFLPTDGKDKALQIPDCTQYGKLGRDVGMALNVCYIVHVLNVSIHVSKGTQFLVF